ncbi:MAG: nucleotidyl transferase AbiEii/AbiGii toxin family protein [Saprospiraceae bacterium]
MKNSRFSNFLKKLGFNFFEEEVNQSKPKENFSNTIQKKVEKIIQNQNLTPNQIFFQKEKERRERQLKLNETHPLFGVEKAKQITEILKKYLDLNLNILYLDCRIENNKITQHIPAIVGNSSRFMDISVIFAEGTFKHFRFTNNIFDVVFCIDRFNYFSEELHFQVYQELMRVLKPGGILILTTLGESYKSKLKKDEKEKFEQGELIFRKDGSGNYKPFVVFHPQSFLEKLFREDTILEHIKTPITDKKYFAQDIWFIQKMSRSLFEVHITTSAIAENKIPKFIEFCKTIQAKPIIIELPFGEQVQQPMISKVFKNISKEELHANIEDLKEKFKAERLEIARVKIEVPLNCMEEGVAAFPDFKGRYFEWHGKVIFENLEELKMFVSKHDNVHLSKNSLKGASNGRFLTIRNYHKLEYFTNQVENIKRELRENNFKLIKEEFEYCVFDSNKKVDKGWSGIPEITDKDYLVLLAAEGFLRRAAQSSEKFILKGSILTRQYLKNKNHRMARDLDYVYGGPINTSQDATKIFDNWVKNILSTQLADDIVLARSKYEDEYWEGVDYEMNEDFPTVSSYLYFSYKNEVEENLSFDISWNLPIEEDLVPLWYTPLEGEPFLIPFTVPLVLQISWKLHQTIIRPRAKDVFDVIMLLENNKLTDEEIDKVVHHFVAECRKDKKSPKLLFHFLNGDVVNLFPEVRTQLDRHNNYATKYGFYLDSSFFQMYQWKTFFPNQHQFNDIESVLWDFSDKLNELGLRSKIEELKL